MGPTEGPRRARFWIAMAALLLGSGAQAAEGQGSGPSAVPSADSRAGPVVETPKGQVRASLAGGVENFFGIPYAAPPVGPLRWRPPQAPAPWQGVRDGSTYGPACPQSYGIDSPRTETEDCLYLNVQRPVGTRADAKLPVVVVIHGGGWRTGSGNNENLDALVREGRMVGVTMNYRLGSLGFLAHPALTREGGESGNYGLMDQQAALRWVHDTIARFGGDPSRVTLGGESAGGGSTCTHMVAPGSAGLFARAFMMSTLCSVTPSAQAEATGETIAREVGCTGPDALACLRAKPVSAFLDAKDVAWTGTSGTRFLPVDPWDAVRAGRFAKVPVLIGGMRDEGRSLLTDWTTRSVPVYDAHSYEAWVRDKFGAQADAVLAVYPYPADAGRYTGTYLVAQLMIQNLIPGSGGLSPCKTNGITEVLARQVPVWAYEFAHESASGWFEIPGYVWASGHATELPYLIPDRGNAGNNARAFGDAERGLAREVLAAWVGFVTTGDPNVAGQPAWPAYRPGQGPFLQFRDGGRSVALPAAVLRAEQRCDFWDRVAE